MWSMIPAVFVILAQATQPSPDARSGKWCFERDQPGAQLCEATEAECNRLRSINTDIARGARKPVKPPRNPGIADGATDPGETKPRAAASRLRQGEIGDAITNGISASMHNAPAPRKVRCRLVV